MVRLSRSLTLLLVACSNQPAPTAGSGSGSAPVHAAPAARLVDAAPAAPKLAVRDEQARKLLLAAAAIPADELRTSPKAGPHLDALNAFSVYTNGTDDARSSPAIVETCATFLADSDPRVRGLAAGCVGRGADRGLKSPSPLRAPVIELLLGGVEHEQDAFVRLELARALAEVAHAKELTPEPGLSAATTDRVLGLLARPGTDPALAASLFEAVFTPTSWGDNSRLRPAVEAFALAQLGKDDPSQITSVAFEAALRIDDPAKVCKMIEPLVRADAKTVGGVVDFIANRHCDDLVERAIDVAIARGRDDPMALAVLDTFEQLRILSPAIRKHIATALTAARTTATEKTILDHYIHVFSHKRDVPCADGIPC